MNDSDNSDWTRLQVSTDSNDYVTTTYHIPYKGVKYTNKEFLRDCATEKGKHWLIRILDVFLYFFMLIVDWLEKKFRRIKNER